MTVQETIKDMIDNYPMLFKTRYEVLDHLFCVIGNGYEWKDGELVDKYPDEKSERKGVDHLENIYNLLSGEEFKKCQEAQDNSFEISHTMFYHEIPKDYKFYPISDYSAIMNLPEDIKPDWDMAANELLYYVFSTEDIDNIKLLEQLEEAE